MSTLTREAYARLYGPTKGDVIRLADTSLLIEIERDHAIYGHELVVGAGKNLRDGEGIAAYLKPSDGILDIVIYGATIVDAVTGIIKADIGIRDGRIVGIGKAGNPDTMPGIVAGLPALPMPAMRPSFRPISALMMPVTASTMVAP